MKHTFVICAYKECEFLEECIRAYYSKYGSFLEFNGYLFMFSETGLNISKKIV